MRGLAIFAVFSTVAVLGCAALSEGDRPPRVRLRGIDGLEMVEISVPGILELREDHHIGSYDAILVPASTMTYERGSLKLTPPAERAFLKALRETLVVASQAADLPILEQPGECVMEVSLRVSRMELSTSDRAEQLAAMTLVMQFRDSRSGAPLLRYALENRVPSPARGVSADEQIRAGLRRVVDDMNLAGPFRDAGLGDDTVLPGCEGRIGMLGRAAADRR